MIFHDGIVTNTFACQSSAYVVQVVRTIRTTFTPSLWFTQTVIVHRGGSTREKNATHAVRIVVVSSTIAT